MNLQIVRANVLTLTEAGRAEAVLCTHNRIVAVGDFAQLCAMAPKAEVIDLDGAVLTPGLTDAHVHLTSYGLAIEQLDLSTCDSVQAACALVAQRAEQTPSGTWIRGGGYLLSQWGLAGYPLKEWLNAVAPTHPVVLNSRDGHSIWVNDQALQATGIHAGTPDPPGGVIVRDHAGNPSGTLLENAVQLLRSRMPQPSADTLLEAAKRGAQRMAEYGFTCVHTMAAEPSTYLRALLDLEARNELPLRIWASVPHAELEHVQALGLRGGFGNQVRLGGAKFFADGALGPRTALMLEDYLGFPNEQGVLVDSKETIIERGRLALGLGLSPLTHAIGDRANRDVLDAFEVLKPFAQANRVRLRLEHAQHLAPAEIVRFAQLGVVASMQPIHLPGDVDAIERTLGPDRASRSFMTRSLREAGTLIALGSDAPVATPDPALGFEAAIRHHDLQGRTWREGQALTRQETLEGYTKNAAFAAGWESWYGQIAPGYASEFTVWNADPSTGPAKVLRALRL